MGESLSGEGGEPENIMAEDLEVSFSDHPWVKEARLEIQQSWLEAEQSLIEKINEEN